MAGWRWLRVLIATVFAASLFTACGGGDDDADNADDDQEQTDDTGSDDTSDGGVTGDASAFFAALGSDGCTGLNNLYASAFGSLGQPGVDVNESDNYFNTLAENAPDEVKDDFEVMADYLRDFIDALEDAGYDFNDPNAASDPSAVGKYIQAFTQFSRDVDSGAVEEASNNIAAWAQTECEVPEG